MAHFELGPNKLRLFVAVFRNLGLCAVLDGCRAWMRFRGLASISRQRRSALAGMPPKDNEPMSPANAAFFDLVLLWVAIGAALLAGIFLSLEFWARTQLARRTPGIVAGMLAAAGV